MRKLTGMLLGTVMPALVGAALAGHAAVASAVPHVSHAVPGATALDSYLDGLSTLRGSFVQTLQDAQGKEIDRTTGKLIVVRPGKMSWETHPQSAANGAGNSAANGNGGTLMVIDGRNIWTLDRDLDQVTVKPVNGALSATPAMLLSGNVNLRDSFTVRPAGTREGLEWVQVEPKSAGADFRQAAFGFDHGALKSMKFENKLGQVATIQFDQLQRNAPVAAGEVSFSPPPGTDVIGKPR